MHPSLRRSSMMTIKSFITKRIYSFYKLFQCSTYNNKKKNVSKRNNKTYSRARVILIQNNYSCPDYQSRALLLCSDFGRDSFRGNSPVGKTAINHETMNTRAAVNVEIIAQNDLRENFNTYNKCDFFFF